MKLTKTLATATAACVLLITALAASAADDKAKKAVKPYPLDTCVVSGEKLGGMGEAFVFAHEGREVKLCCESCKKDFDKETTKFVAKIDEAAKKVKPYALTTCVVSGEKLGADAPALVYKGQEFKLCCKDCLKSFNKEPDKYLKKVQPAAK